jgi:dephospho-CoA kinase
VSALWQDKFVIGLTGNIATGKSVVRKMLEHAGAFGIDADALSHRAIQPGAPGYQSVIETFGQYIVKENGEIDRSKLGQIVFADPKALKLLEAIVHPIVRAGVDQLVRASKHRVIVIEAIKLLESPLRTGCDTVWVVVADEKEQMARMQTKRNMDPAQAKQRMAAQSSQEEKRSTANTVIDNSGSIEQTWEQVKAAWKKLFPQAAGETVPTRLRPTLAEAQPGDRQVVRARPRQAPEIAAFTAGSNGFNRSLSKQQVMDAFGDKAFLLMQGPNGLMGLAGWKVENLVARVDDINLQHGLPVPEHLPFLISEVEEASRELQCEIALIFVSPELAAYRDLWIHMGYEERLPQELTIGAWQEAALESARKDTVMLFKQLRADRVLRPI